MAFCSAILDALGKLEPDFRELLEQHRLQLVAPAIIDNGYPVNLEEMAKCIDSKESLRTALVCDTIKI